MVLFVLFVYDVLFLCWFVFWVVVGYWYLYFLLVDLVITRCYGFVVLVVDLWWCFVVGLGVWVGVVVVLLVVFCFVLLCGCGKVDWFILQVVCYVVCG